jgi:hypothetical protein
MADHSPFFMEIKMRIQRTWKKTKAVQWLLKAKQKIAIKEFLTEEERKQLGKLNKSLKKYFPPKGNADPTLPFLWRIK